MEFVLLSSAFWAIFDYQRKRLTARFEPSRLSVLFTLLALPGYILVWLYNGLPLPDWSAYWMPATLSGAFAAVGSLHYLKALKHGYISEVIPILCLTPVISGIFGWLYLEEVLVYKDWLAITLISLGCFLLTVKKFGASKKALTSALITAFSWGICIVFDKQALQHTSVNFHLVYLSTLIVVLTYLSLRPSLELHKALFDKQIWFAVIIFVCAIVFQLTALSVEHPGVVEATKRAIGMISALAVGFWLLKEKVSLSQCAITVGLILCIWILL